MPPIRVIQTTKTQQIQSLVSARIETPESLPAIRLARTSESTYGHAAHKSRRNEFWWYLNGLALYPGFSRPFEDVNGRWWYRVKPGFAWPVDFFTPLSQEPSRAPNRFLIGWQWPTQTRLGNSRVWMNVIHRLSRYALASVATAKRRAVLRGLRNLEIGAASPADASTAGEAVEVWNSHVERTGWNQPMNAPAFSESWRELNDWPGTTVVTARRKRDGAMCAWMILRCIDETLYIDTMASHTDRLAERPNDALVFATLMAGQRGGLVHAHYSMLSRLGNLERFKQSLGFAPYGFAAGLRLRRPVEWAMRRWRPTIYERLLGNAACDKAPDAGISESL